jgi:hypothetical protein
MKRPSVSWMTIPLIVDRVRLDSVLFGVPLTRMRSVEPDAAEAATVATSATAATAR